jgi:peptide deformylase
MPAKKNSQALLPKDEYELTSADINRAAEEYKLGIVAPHATVLTQRAKALAPDDIDAEHVKDVIERLYAAAQGQRRDSRKGKKRRTLVGLAAPQIGESLRIILVDPKVEPSRKTYGKLQCFINPVIIWRSRETEEGREGCFSAGPVWGLVRRPVAVKIRALTPEGKQIERIFEGFTARIVSHEIDHLDGIRFADRIRSDKKRHWVHAEELDLYPKHIKHWERICTRERWEALKNTSDGDATPTR